MLKINKINQQGFTLIEILLVVALIGILASIVIIAINPSKNLSDTRDAQRKSDVTTILNAVYQYSVDINGTIPATITTTPTEICKTGVAPATCTTNSLVDLSVVTANEKYITSVPVDPTTSTAISTKYSIFKTANNRVTVTAVGENAGTISVTR